MDPHSLTETKQIYFVWFVLEREKFQKNWEMAT